MASETEKHVKEIFQRMYSCVSNKSGCITGQTYAEARGLAAQAAARLTQVTIEEEARLRAGK